MTKIILDFSLNDWGKVKVSVKIISRIRIMGTFNLGPLQLSICSSAETSLFLQAL